MMKIHSLSLLIVLHFCFSLVGVQEGWALEYFASPIDTFVYDYQPPNLYDYNNVAGSDRDYSVDTNQNIIYPWNYMKFEVTEDDSRVSFTVDQFTYLSNQWAKDSNEPIVDAVLRQGKTTFQPFDSSLGTLNRVQVQYEWNLGSVLALSLYDDCFFCDAEGEAAGESKLGWAFGNVGSVEDYEQVIYNYTRIRPQASMAGFAGTIINNLNLSSDAGAGASSVLDATICLLNPESCSQDIDWVRYASVYFAKAYSSVQGTVTFTPEEYLASMNGDQEFQIALRKWDGHSFS